jgi:hypothetical protein
MVKIQCHLLTTYWNDMHLKCKYEYRWIVKQNVPNNGL